jgi:ketosteroid isomerase-like protein
VTARRSKPRKTSRRPAARKPSRRAKPRPGRSPARAEKRAPARKPAARAKPAPRPAAAKPAPGGALLALARKIVRATQDPTAFALRDLYADGAVSREATGEISTGIAELEAKLARWQAMQQETEWTPRNVFGDGSTICIEWDATVRMRDGRIVPLSEVAIHQVRDGRIVAERFYYDPRALAPQSA